MKTAGALRLIAVFEALKGAAILLAGFGLLSLLHKDVQRMAEELVGHFHLNPASRYPRIFLEASANLGDSRLVLLAALALVYACVRLIEAYGLWRGRRWAEWFAVASGGIYVPIEIYELFHHVSWMTAGTLALNTGIVAYMACALRQSNRDRAASGTHTPPGPL